MDTLNREIIENKKSYYFYFVASLVFAFILGILIPIFNTHQDILTNYEVLIRLLDVIVSIRYNKNH